MARTYTAGEAARALGISLDTLRRWDRQGRIRVQRDSANRRVVAGREVERLRGEDRRTLSARNRLEGVVREVKIEGLLAEVELDVTKGGRLVAVKFRDYYEVLGVPRTATADDIKRAHESLTQASRTLADAMYRQTTSGPAGGPQGSGQPPQGDVVDAEFKDADDRKS